MLPFHLLPSIGSWALQHAPELQWSDGDRWHVSIDLPANGVYEYKYVILSSDGQHAISWQRGNNCVLAIKPDDDRVEVFDNWYVVLCTYHWGNVIITITLHTGMGNQVLRSSPTANQRLERRGSRAGQTRWMHLLAANAQSCGARAWSLSRHRRYAVHPQSMIVTLQ